MSRLKFEAEQTCGLGERGMVRCWPVHFDQKASSIASSPPTLYQNKVMAETGQIKDA